MSSLNRRDRLPGVDCVRSLTTLWTVLRSSTLVATTGLSVRGPNWVALSHTRSFHFALGGANSQSDVFLLLSGLLLGTQLRAELRSRGAVAGTHLPLRRIARLLPGLLLLLACSLLLGDCVAFKPKALAASVRPLFPPGPLHALSSCSHPPLRRCSASRTTGATSAGAPQPGLGRLRTSRSTSRRQPSSRWR